MRRRWLVFLALALVVSFLLVRVVGRPFFTDAFYYYNAAERLATGQGLTDPYLWTYIGAPESLPAPSHLYWMPMSSLIAAFGMTVTNMAGNYAAAQWPFAVLLALASLVAFWLGGRLGGTARHAWAAGLLMLFNPFYARWWGATDSFAPYALIGSVCMVALGFTGQTLGERRFYGWAAAAGGLTGLAHLTRADGLVFLIAGWMVILWPFQRQGTLLQRLGGLVILTGAYGLVMLPWFIRNLDAVGSALPVGGAQAIWFTSYDDLFKYPPVTTAERFFANGLNLLWETRQLALSNNLARFVAEQGVIVLTPFMLLGLWNRRHEPLLRGFWLSALGIHLVMTFVFPLPGYRGGLFHSAAALLPWWAALGLLGLDDAVDWIARRRRRWGAGTAKLIFTAALVGFTVYLAISMAINGQISAETPGLYPVLAQQLPSDARVMINDPAALYYYTGLGGVVLPNESPDVIPEIARRYGVDYLLLEGQEATPLPLWSLYEQTPDFLIPVPLDIPNMRLYAIDV